MERAFSHKFGAWALVVFLIFLMLQAGLSVRSNVSFLSLQGAGQLIWLASFLVAVFTALKTDMRGIIFFVFLYQCIAVFFIYGIYVNVVGDPLGVAPVDALTYHNLALSGSYVDLIDYFDLIPHRWDMSDYGFPIIARFIYMIPGDPIVNMKFVNICAHVGSTSALYYSARLLNYDRATIKLVVALFGFYPASVFFNASGLKEPIFSFFVCGAVLLMLVAAQKRHGPLFYGVAGASIFATGLFRFLYPIFLGVSFFTQLWSSTSSKYKLLIRVLIFIAGVFSVGLMMVLFQGAIAKLFGISILERQSYRLASDVGWFEQVGLIVVGIIGPLPSFSYSAYLDDYVMLAVPNYVKVCLSLSFLWSCLKSLRAKYFEPSSVWVFLLLNFAMLILSAGSFDHRFHYPFIASYILLAGNGLGKGMDVRRLSFWSYFAAVIVLIAIYNDG